MARVKTFVPGGSLLPNDLNAIQDYIDAQIALVTSASLPGDLRVTARATAPDGWLICQGQAVSRATYAALYAALGGAASRWGQGNGSSTFNVPNLIGRALIGAGTGGGGVSTRLVGESGGVETHVLTVAEMPAHTHMQKRGVGGTVGTGTFSSTWDQSDLSTGSAGGGGAHQNMPPWAAVNVIVKT